MRVGTWTMYTDYSRQQQSTFSRVNNVFNQISSGQNIQYGYEDINIQLNTLRLNDQLGGLELNKAASWAGREYGVNTDVAMSDMVSTLTKFKTQLVKAASQTNSQTDLNAIAQELKGYRQHLINLANSSLDGQYLFAGTASSVKPVSQDGTYNGNSGHAKAIVSPGVALTYNIDGRSLFLGQDKDYTRQITTNVPQTNRPLALLDPPEYSYVNDESEIQMMTGNPGDGAQTYFYVSGTNTSGASFKQAFSMDANAPMSDVLLKIKNMYSGNVDVSLNAHGQIEVKDLLTGSSKLDFRMVASNNAVNLTQTTGNISVGDTSLTVADATGIQPGDVLNLERVGQVTISSVDLTTNTINFVGTPLTNGMPDNSTAVNVTKALTPSNNTLLDGAVTITSPATSATITVDDSSAAVVGGTLAIIDAGGNSISGQISSINGNNITIAFQNQSTVTLADNATVKFATPASLSQTTTTTAASAAGANSITVSSTQGMSVGGSVTITDSSGTQTATISAIDSSTGTVTFATPGLMSAFTSGAEVTVNASMPVFSNTANVATSVTTTSPSTNITLTNTAGLTVGGQITIAGKGVFSISAINSSSNSITIDTLDQAGIVISSGLSASNSTMGSSITEFTKSGSSPRVLGDVSGYNEYLDHRMFNFNLEMHRKDNGEIAGPNDQLGDILDNMPTGITLNNATATFSPALSTTSTVTDYVSAIQSALDSQFGGSMFAASYVSGKIQIQDQSISLADAQTSVSSLRTVTLNAPDGTFSPINGLISDQSDFAKKGNTLLGNVSQIVKSDNMYATTSTRLIEVAGVPIPSANNTTHPAGIEGKVITMPFTDIIGNDKVATLNFQYDPNFTSTTPEGMLRTIYSVAQDTTVSAGVAAGATSITIPAGTDTYPGSELKIRLDDDTVQTVTVASSSTAGSTTTLTFSPALSDSVTLGATITIVNSFDVPNAAYPSSITPPATTSTQPNNFTYDQLLNVISMSVSSHSPTLGVTTGAVTASSGTGSVAVSNEAFEAATIGGDIMLYDNNDVPYYATVTGMDTATNTLSFSYNQGSWSSAGFTAGDKVQVGYNAAANAAQVQVPVKFDQTSQIKITDNTRSVTNANFSLYDSTISNGYGVNEAYYTTALSVNSNNALEIQDPYVDFFAQIDEAIAAVEQGKVRPDPNGDDPRNSGVQNCMTMIEHILDHTERKHTDNGAATNTFQENFDRIEILTVNVAQVRSNFADTDMAAAAVLLNQRTISYQALMSIATKINSLTLVNYVK